MGRNYKEKKQLNIKFDWYIYQRFKKFLNVLNKQNGKNYNVTSLLEDIVKSYLNENFKDEHLYDEDGNIMK